MAVLIWAQLTTRAMVADMAREQVSVKHSLSMAMPRMGLKAYWETHLSGEI